MGLRTKALRQIGEAARQVQNADLAQVARGWPGACSGDSWKLAFRGPNKAWQKVQLLMFEMRTDSRSTSVNSLFVTYPHYSNLYGRIEQFVRFLRGGDAMTWTSLCVIVLCDVR